MHRPPRKSSKKSKNTKRRRRRPVFLVRRPHYPDEWEPSGVQGGNFAAYDPWDWEFDGPEEGVQGSSPRGNREDDEIDLDEWEFDGVRGGDYAEYDPWEPDGVIGGDIFLAEPPSVRARRGSRALALEIEDGRYLGGSHRLILELRVDFDGSAIISGDLFTNAASGRHYLVSFRTAPGIRVDREARQAWSIIAEDAQGATSTGKVWLKQSMMSEAVVLLMYLDEALQGLLVRDLIEMTAEWQSSSMRSLAIEMEREENVPPPPVYEKNGEIYSIQSVMEKAGIELSETGQGSLLPELPDGVRWGTEQLHTVMLMMTPNALDKPQWRQNLLWLGKPSRKSLLGVMFDSRGALQRQGTAVFRNEIETYFPRDTDRKILQTTAHEIGHALNLTHRFEREVGRADSTSIMNYDWRYRGGNRRYEYWRKFDFSFDDDELSFLRHGARNKIIPGGAPFHSVTYWADGKGGYSPNVPEIPSDALGLTLEAPRGRTGSVFEFGQPVLLRVTLTNNTGRSLPFNTRLLDPKSGFLEVMIGRRTAGPQSASHMHHFHPLYERCMDVAEDDVVVLKPGKFVSENLNLTFGASGFSFAEPGLYDIRVVGSSVINTDDADPDNDLELIYVSNQLTIMVGMPRSREDEAEVTTVLFREDVGTYFTLGGSAHLHNAESDLIELCKRRLHGRKTVCDPIAANVIRCRGIDAQRWSLEWSNGAFTVKDGNPEEAVNHLIELGKEGLGVFDGETARTTIALLEKNLGRLEKTKAARPRATSKRSKA